ncbi:MAG: N-acetylmuramoyl-L-alanine amidase [Herbinix sp.]|jgi:N-acetylmuramoyl-L-alanine amidase|nr:N-acetylmuramoyl-L-alanine amidase [Herbinix sp.]
MAKVILDAGHGGSDLGDINYSQMEKTDNLRLALAVGEILEQSGIEVAYTRTKDSYLSQIDRVNIANAEGADLLVSIHRLFGRGVSPGLGFFVAREGEIEEKVANNIGSNLSDAGYTNYEIITRTDLPILRDTNMPSVMVGIGFMKSEEENLLFNTHFDDIANAIAKGIIQTLENQENENSSASNIIITSNSNCYSCKNKIITKFDQRGPKVILDAGHGGSDTGEVIDENMEKNENLKLTLAVGNILMNNGVDVIYTRTTDIHITKDELIKFVNDTKGDLFVSMHRTSNVGRGTAAGAECLVQGEDEFARTVADNINNNLEEIGYVNIGNIQADLDILRFDSTPAVIVLIGIFRSNTNQMLYDIKFNETAYAIAQGIIESFGINMVSALSNYRYRIQVGLFRAYNQALNLQTRLIMQGYTADIVQQGDSFAVHVGDFSNIDGAAALELVIRFHGYNTLLVAV